MVSESVAPCIFNLSIRWRWAISFKLRPFYSWGNGARYQ